MDDASTKVLDLIFGRWRSQILYAGVKLGVFDALASGPREADDIASALHVDAALLYRLMRALGSLELLHEDDARTFALTPQGELLCRNHPRTLRGQALLQEGPEHYAAWKHLSALITEGRQDGFVREFGQPIFAYAAEHPSYRTAFNEGMSSLSSIESMLVLEALESYDFTELSHLCDVGGGYGHTLCSLLAQHPRLKGAVLELPNVIAQRELLWADKMGVGDRCAYTPGDMFREAPLADAYMLKRVLHDWNDNECLEILSTLRQAAPHQGRVWIVEYVIPGPNTSHFSKLVDIHMLVLTTGRERTLEEYATLLEEAGWQYHQTWYPASKMLGVVEGVKA